MQKEPSIVKFTSHAEFLTLINECIACAGDCLQLFDPDFTRWSLGASATISLLNQFLLLKESNRLQLATHHFEYLQQSCPRFLTLLKNFDHAIECRQTPKNLRHLTDSFCIADESRIVRRFHADHFRGVATLGNSEEIQIYANRFAGIWIESLPGLHPTTLGL